MFSLIYVWINGWVNNREAGDLRHHGHYDVIIMQLAFYDMLFTKAHVDVNWGVFMQAIVLFGNMSFLWRSFHEQPFCSHENGFPLFLFFIPKLSSSGAWPDVCINYPDRIFQLHNFYFLTICAAMCWTEKKVDFTMWVFNYIFITYIIAIFIYSYIYIIYIFLYVSDCQET